MVHQIASHTDLHQPGDNPNHCKREHRSDDAVVGMLPWLVSIALHLGLAILAVLVVWSVSSKPIDDPDSFLPPSKQISHVPSLLQLDVESKMPSISKGHKRPSIQRQVRHANLEKTEPMAIHFVGIPGTPFDNDGDLMRGLDINGMSEFFGLPGSDCNRIVYVIDASGSLLDTMPFVLEELERSISTLSDRQYFTAIFFNGSGVIEVPPLGMKRAHGHLKRSVTRWISHDQGNIFPTGGSDPLEAMRKAMGYRPDLVYLLSDNITGSGAFEQSQRHVLNKINEMNPKQVPINTIQFLYEDPLIKSGHRGTMDLISEQSGGQYKFIDGMEIGLR